MARVKGLTDYAKKVRARCIELELTHADIAKLIGYSTPVVTAIIGGRYKSRNMNKIVQKINDLLGIDGFPEASASVPSKEWVLAVKHRLYETGMTGKELAASTGIPHSYYAQMISRRCINKDYVKKINECLGINVAA